MHAPQGSKPHHICYLNCPTIQFHKCTTALTREKWNYLRISSHRYRDIVVIQQEEKIIANQTEKKTHARNYTRKRERGKEGKKKRKEKRARHSPTLLAQSTPQVKTDRQAIIAHSDDDTNLKITTSPPLTGVVYVRRNKDCAGLSFSST